MEKPSYREPAHDQQQTDQQSADDHLADQRVILTKAKTSDRADDPFRTFQEWSTEADAKAYADL